MFMMVYNWLAWLLIIVIAILILMVIFPIVGKSLSAVRDGWPFNRPRNK